MTLAPGSPVLALPGRAVQIGLASPTVLRRLTREQRVFLAGLEGGRPVGADDRKRHARLIAALTRAGAWNAGPRHTVRAAVGGDPALSGGVATALRAMGVRVRRETGEASLTVIAGLAAADPSLTGPLMVDSTPHIAILADDAGAWVSHVIQPGLTACTRCRDVALTRANPLWPVVAMQCVGRRPQLNPLTEAVAVARAAARALAWIESNAAADSVAHGGIGERVDSLGAVTADPLLPEPDCACGAAGAVGDELAARRARWR